MKISAEARTWLYIGLCLLALVIYQVLTGNRTGRDIFIDSYYQLSYLEAHRHPEWFRLDPLLGNPSVSARAFIAYPAFYFLLGLGVSHLGFVDTLSLFQLLLGIVYLFGACLLLFTYTRRPWLSALMAAISACCTQVFPGEQWGVLSINSVIPGSFFMAFSPFILWAWLKYQDIPAKRRFVFLATGIIGTFHPLSWLIFTFSMLFAQLVRGRFSLENLKEISICGILSAIPLIPFFISWSGLMHAGSHLSPADQQRALEMVLTIFQPVRLQFLWRHWADVLQNLGWILLTAWAFRKARSRVPKDIVYFTLGSVLLFVATYALNELILIPRNMVFIDGYRTLKYLFLPATLIISLWLQQWRGAGLLARCALVWLLLVILNFPLLFEDFRKAPLALHVIALRQWMAFVMSADPQEQASFDDVTKAATWMKSHLPTENTLLHVSLPRWAQAARIRALAGRSITNTVLDGGPFYLYDRGKMGDWWQTSVYLERVHHQSGFCSEAETRFAQKLGATYLVCPADSANLGLTPIYRNDSVAIFALQKRL